jgi:hypothetical protein
VRPGGAEEGENHSSSPGNEAYPHVHNQLLYRPIHCASHQHTSFKYGYAISLTEQSSERVVVAYFKKFLSLPTTSVVWWSVFLATDPEVLG